MYKQKIGISIASDYSLPTEEVLKIVKDVGFDAISPVFEDRKRLDNTVSLARELGLLIQSLHAPFLKAADMWSEDISLRTAARDELFEAVDACVRLSIPILVVHTWIGFDYEFNKALLDYTAFDELVGYAGECKIKIAFENAEGEEYLFALMEHFEGCDTVGFCWDSGHEICYNRSADLLSKFGDRLIMTHLNDNLGISRHDGKTFWTDDLHLLPYDGVGDWDYNLARLKRASPQSVLNFELLIASKPGRHENDVYAKLPLVQYFTEAYKRACKLAYRYAR